MRRTLAQSAQFVRTLGTVFAARWYRLVALVWALMFATLALAVPVWFIPANTFALTFALIRPVNYAALFVLSLASGVLVAVNVFLFRRRNEDVRTASGSGAGLLASLGSAVLLTSCGCGVGFVLGIFGIGIGGASFLVANQLAISLTALAIVLVALHLSLKRAANVCTLCAVSLSADTR